MKRIFSILFAVVLVLSFSLIPSALVGASPGPGLVGEWHFDEGSGTTTSDSSGYDNHGTIVGASWTTSGKLGQALSFDGIDDYVAVEFSSSLDFTAAGQDFSAEAWINLDQLKDFNLVFQQEDDGGPGRAWLYVRTNGAVESFIGGSATVTATGLITAGNWHHVALTFDKGVGSQTGTLKIYVDGVQRASSTRTFEPSTGDYRIGIHKLNLHPLDGLIDEVRIWDTAHPPLHVDDDGVQYATPYTTIQAAVDAAQPGDTIIVHEGTYYETVIIRSDDHHLALKGEEGAVIFGTNAGIELQGGTHHIEISGFEITISNPVWDNPGISAWTNTGDADYAVMHHITIHHNYIHGCYKGILFGAWVWSPWGPGISHHHITIHHNVVSNNVDLGISFWGVSESSVNHNVIVDNGNGAGPTGLGDGLVFLGVSDSNANHNEIHGNDVVGLGVYDGATGNNFNNNDITNNDNLGILLTGWNFPTTGNIFVRNDATSNNAWDIRCIDEWGSEVYGNKWVRNKYDDANPDPPQ